MEEKIKDFDKTVRRRTPVLVTNGNVETEPITMIENAGFEAVERDTVYNRVEKVAA